MLSQSKHFFKKTTKLLKNKMKKAVPQNRKKHKKVPAYLTSTETIPEQLTQPGFLNNNIE